MNRRLLRFAILGTVLALAVPAVGGADTWIQNFEPAGQLRIELDFGAVEVVSHAANAVRAEGQVRGLGADGFRFSASRDGDTWVLSGHAEPWLQWMTDAPRVLLRVQVPPEASVEISTRDRVRVESVGRVRIRTSGGPVSVRGVADRVDVLSLGDAAIEIAQVRGDVRAATRRGAIDLTQIDGDVEARADGGRIVIDGVSGSVVADTRDAAIRARFAHSPSGQFRTLRGEIEIAYRAGSGVTLDAVATGGCVFVDRVVRSGCGEVQQAVVGPIHGGGQGLELRARDGDIRMLAQRAPTPAESSQQTAAVTASHSPTRTVGTVVRAQ